MRPIDAQAYCKELIAERDYDGRSQDFKEAMEVAIAVLGDMPTVEAQDVKHGQWREGYLIHRYGCSCCGKRQDTITPYCPSCGAKMDQMEEHSKHGEASKVTR